ncbi:universal stress protein [Ascidiimonas aurantiaca]|uniref:universal stress protein n=1 Tax=Ascidiimonas aurantiaca TaxID=1685432 RepID=UPI0030ECEA97
MKRIVLPTDFSNNAWNAIAYALQLFKDEDCTFYFLHTYVPAFYRMDYMMGGPAFSGLPDPMIEVSLSGLENTVVKAKENYPNPKHTYETLSAFNILSDEIKEVVEREDIDMVVMGTQGATGAKEIFLGSNTVFVLRKATVPVLAIPENCHFTPVEKILFPSDYLTMYKRRELKAVCEIAKNFNASITVLHVLEEGDISEKQEKNREFIEECMQGIEHTFKELEGQVMPKAIYEYLEINKFDMLAMMNRKHSFFERLLLRQNVDDIGFHIDIPFLVMRDTSH